MIIKNVSGSTQYIAIGQRSGLGSAHARGREVLDDALATFGDDAKSVKDARRLAVAGIIEIVDGPASLSEQGSVHSPARGSITLSSTGPSNGDYVTISGVKFEFAASAGTLAAGVVWAGAGAVIATAASTLITAINANPQCLCKAGTALSDNSTKIIPIVAHAGNPDGSNHVTVGADYTLVKSGSNIAVSDTTLDDGVKGHCKETSIITHEVSAGNVTDESWVICTGLLSTPSNFFVQVNRAGAILPTLACTFVFDTVVPGNLIVDDNAGNTLQAGDIITVLAHGA